MNLENALLRGLRSAQPLASAVAEGSLYFVTDETVVEQSRASAWVAYSGAGAAAISQLTGDVTAGPGSGSQAASIANNAVVTAKIADDAVTYAKIQNVAASKLLGRSASGSGNAEELTLGTNLSLTGTTLNAAAGGGGGLVYLATRTASASAYLEFLSLITSTYDNYLFQISALIGAGNGALALQVSTDNGATWKTSADYPYALRYVDSTGALGVNSNTGGYTAGGGIYGGQAGGWTPMLGCTGDISMFNALNAAMPTLFHVHTTIEGGSFVYYDFAGFINYKVANAVNAVRFYYDSSNIASGTIRLYGYAKT